MWKRRSTSLVPSGIGQLTLYHCQKKIRTKEGNNSDVIDLHDHRLYTPYECETHKRHWPYAGFAPLL